MVALLIVAVLRVAVDKTPEAICANVQVLSDVEF
jgi:hypothetical protein